LDIGQLLKKLREQARVTQSDLAEKCGIPYQNVSRIERGAREGKISALNRFARALGYQMEIVLPPIPRGPGEGKRKGEE
jgi:transcriptional regulator with XRE-family HTH domain